MARNALITCDWCNGQETVAPEMLNPEKLPPGWVRLVVAGGADKIESLRQAIMAAAHPDQPPAQNALPRLSDVCRTCVQQIQELFNQIRIHKG